MGGHHRRALHFNALVDDSRQKLTQRLAIYMGMERYDLAASLLPLFESQPWLEDGLRYQLAYACYATGRGEQLAMLANAIEDEWLSEGVVELMEALERP